VALAERAAAGILAAQAHVEAFIEQRREREMLGQRPIDALAVIDRLRRASTTRCTVLCMSKSRGNFSDGAAELAQRIDANFGFAATIIVDRQCEAGPFTPSSQSALLTR
jgi:hypothetical protein